MSCSSFQRALKFVSKMNFNFHFPSVTQEVSATFGPACSAPMSNEDQRFLNEVIAAVYLVFTDN